MSPLDELMPFSQIKLVVFDLDGTLLKSLDGKPGERILQLHASARTAGVRITVATGRTLFGAQRVLGALSQLDGLPAVLYNGSVVIQPGTNRLLYRDVIQPSAVMAIVEMALDMNVKSFFYNFHEKKNLDMASAEGWPEKVTYIGPLPLPLTEFNGMSVDAYPLGDQDGNDCVAILILPKNTEEASDIYLALSKIDGVSTTKSGSKYIEIRPANSTKAVGLTELSKALYLRSDEVIAVGDNDNDVELLQWAGIGVSVSGGSPAAHAASQYTSRYGPERSAIEVLDLIRRAKRLNKSRPEAYGEM